jgi:hypothetical protein
METLGLLAASVGFFVLGLALVRYENFRIKAARPILKAGACFSNKHHMSGIDPKRSYSEGR